MDKRQKAEAAKRLLQDGMLEGAIEDIVADISVAWRNTANEEERKDLWYMQRAMTTVVSVIEGYVASYNFERNVK
jgi:hypothetical protein